MIAAERTQAEAQRDRQPNTLATSMANPRGKSLGANQEHSPAHVGAGGGLEKPKTDTAQWLRYTMRFVKNACVRRCSWEELRGAMMCPGPRRCWLPIIFPVSCNPWAKGGAR